MPPSPNWQPLSLLPQIARLIDDMAFGATEQLGNLAQAAAHPHLLDDATLDRTERVYGEQRDFLAIYAQQLSRWREGRLTTAQEREIARLEQVLAALRPQLDEILARAQALRSGTIDAIQRMSDEELGRQVLLGAGSLGQAEDLLRAASGGSESGRVGRGKPKPGAAPTGSPLGAQGSVGQAGASASSGSKGRTAPAPRPAGALGGAPFALPPEVTASREHRGGATIYTFTHASLGQLGRVIVQQVAPHQTQFSAEVSGDPADPMTEERKRLFNPIAEAIAAALDHLPPVGSPAPLQPTPADETVVASRLFQCPACAASVALQLFADGRPLEDAARLMHATIQKLDVPTWVTGTADASGVADVLKVHPNREPVCRVPKRELNRLFDTLMEAHCRRRGRR
jgi:hypothetical protein